MCRAPQDAGALVFPCTRGEYHEPVFPVLNLPLSRHSFQAFFFRPRSPSQQRPGQQDRASEATEANSQENHTSHTMSESTQQNMERVGFRRTLRKWKDSMTGSTSISQTSHTSQPIPTSSQSAQTSSPLPQQTHTTTKPLSSQSSQSSLPSQAPSDALALFQPGIQTIIHSPLDKRNKGTSPAAVFRRSCLGPRRHTASVDYFAWGKGFASETSSSLASPSSDGGSVSTSHTSRDSRVRFSMRIGGVR